MSTSLITDTLVLQRTNEWELNGNQIKGIPGTWIRASEKQIKTFFRLNNQKNVHIICFLCCPKCHYVYALSDRIHTIDAVGKVSPDFPCRHCDLHRILYLDRYYDKPLYCMTYIEDGNIKFLYTHATSQQEARKNMGYKSYKIVAIAPAIGFEVVKTTGNSEILKA